jgi:hypothetical protein
MAITATESTTVASSGQAPAAATTIPSPNPSAPTGTTPEAPPQAESQQTVDIPDDLIRQRIADFDPREIQRLNRKFANLVGNEADRLAERRLEARKDALRAEWEADWRNRQAAAELRQLRDTNPELYVQREKELEEALFRQREDNDRIRRQVDSEVSSLREASDRNLIEWANSLPEPVQQKLRDMGQIDEGDWAASRRKFMQIATDLHREHLRESIVKEDLPKELERELAKRSKAIEDGVKAAQAAESNSREPAPDTSGGAAAVGPMTQDEFNRIRHDPMLRRQHKDRIAAGVQARLITR